MPSTSKKQRNFMAAAAHNPAFAKKVGISQTVAKEFNQADKGKTFKEGGGMAKSDMKEDMKMDKKQDVAMIKKAFKEHDAQEHKGGKGTKLALKKGGMAMKKMAGGGLSAGHKSANGETTNPMGDKYKKGGMAMKKMAGGGLSAGHKSANGVAKKGLTKGKEIKMCSGGMSKKAK